MVCPCCGGKLAVEAHACDCGARFVGAPLVKPHIQVKRFGPVMWAYTILFAVVAAALIFTKWLALAAVLVLWAARRAMNLSRREAHLYGGLQAATALLIVTAIAGATAGGYAISYIPRYLENYQERQKAATIAEMYRVANLLEEHRRKAGDYPSEAEHKIFGELLPQDHWGTQIKYDGFIESMAGAIKQDSSLPPPKVSEIRAPQRSAGVTGFGFYNYTLHSAGPDGVFDTEDDIVMRDGVIISSPESKKYQLKMRTNDADGLLC